jgi:hypothetical protein
MGHTAIPPTNPLVEFIKLDKIWLFFDFNGGSHWGLFLEKGAA